MESDGSTPAEGLGAASATQEANARDLPRPKRYWVMLGLFLSVFALLPYMTGLPVVVQFVAPVLLVLLIVLVAAWKQPTAVRQIKPSGRMVLQIAGFAALVGVVAGVSRGAYAAQGWWWAPLAAAVILFGVVVTLGPLMDRSWARQARTAPARLDRDRATEIRI
ncbi:hypothetical protein PTQ19_06405 [Microbacterium esteraromaticum]|uniref:hypothetical protein n=1 Tax=Microbacterium esteraromaticum TaxID=57043 RepID=UPI0023675365|nr:hypothetical protein [Microbacterium esteraromaticum]WDH80062.1 hypothetical protein PTQ19_06405 [Microbacterium esteraromaticum]